MHADHIWRACDLNDHVDNNVARKHFIIECHSYSQQVVSMPT